MLDKVIRRVYNAQCKKKESGDQPMKKTLYSLMLNEEVVREIENQCANNQMRDVFFEEIETDDPVSWVRGFLKGKDVELTVDEKENGDLTVYAVSGGVSQKFLMTKL